MSDLSVLYDEQILEHDKKPRNYGKLEAANRFAEGHNTTCGDHFTVYVHYEDDVVKGISFEGTGCAISKASASMMTRSVKGKGRPEVEALFKEFHRMVLGELDEESEPNNLGHLKVFAGVRQFPARVKCASLSWHTMHAALEMQTEVSTEHLGPDLTSAQMSA